VKIWLGEIGSVFGMDQASYDTHCGEVMRAISIATIQANHENLKMMLMMNSIIPIGNMNGCKDSIL
jgi:hypothetical protein